MAFGQSKVKTNFADSLETAFSQSSIKSEKAKIQFQLSDYWSFRDVQKAFNHLNIAKTYIGDDRYLTGLYYFYQAGIYYDNDRDKAQKLYIQADDFLKQISTKESYEYRAKLWHNYISISQAKGDNKTFMDMTISHCIPLAEKSGNKSLLAGYYVDVGMMSINYNEFQKAITYLNRAVDVLKTAPKNDEMSAWAFLNLATTYYEMKDYPKMQEVLTNANSALKKIPESQYNALLYLQNARYYRAVSNLKEASDQINKGLKFSKNLNLDYDYLTLLFEKAQVLKDEKKYSEAIAILEQLLNNKKYQKTRKNRLSFLTELADLEKENGNFESALEYKQQFIELNDSVQHDNEKMQVLNIEAQFKTKEQQESLRFLAAANRQKSIILIISLSFLVFAILAFIYILKQRKKENEQKLLFVKQHRKHEVEQALYEGEMQEQERIAKDLHDGVGGRISGIKIGLESLNQNLENESLEKMCKQLEICLNEIRTTARNLTPETLKRFGLTAAIKDYCQNLSNPSTRISCYCKNLEVCTEIKKQIQIFHIVQEAVSNAIKHANAKEILVQCTLENGLLMMDIEDNGKGFQIEKVHRNLGLNNIEKRVRSLNGKFSINSSPENGTTLIIEAHI